MNQMKCKCGNCIHFTIDAQWGEDLPPTDAMPEYDCKLGNDMCAPDFCCDKFELSDRVDSSSLLDDPGYDPCLMKKDTALIRAMARQNRIRKMGLDMERAKRLLEKYKQHNVLHDNDPSSIAEFYNCDHELIVSREDASALIIKLREVLSNSHLRCEEIDLSKQENQCEGVKNIEREQEKDGLNLPFKSITRYDLTEVFTVLTHGSIPDGMRLKKCLLWPRGGVVARTMCELVDRDDKHKLDGSGFCRMAEIVFDETPNGCWERILFEGSVVAWMGSPYEFIGSTDDLTGRESDFGRFSEDLRKVLAQIDMRPMILKKDAGFAIVYWKYDESFGSLTCHEYANGRDGVLFSFNNGRRVIY